MSWQTFEPMDLFGEGAGAPVEVWRSCFADFDEDVDEAWRTFGLEHLDAFMGGRSIPVPRLEGWWGDRPYRFGGRTVQPRSVWPLELTQLMELVEDATQESFDSCFINFYRDEKDQISWHADDESWIGPVVASVSFGATRRFWLRHKFEKGRGFKGFLQHGDLLLMKAGCQDEWEHRVPRETAPTGPRINFTFRQTKAVA